MTAFTTPVRLGRAAGGGWRPHWPPPGARYTSGKRRGRLGKHAVRTDAAIGAVTDDAHLRFSPADGAYATVPAWRSRTHYLAALPWHPRLHETCRRNGVRVELFLTAMALEAARADTDTGRGIAVAHDALAQLLGCTTRHVRNVKRTARELGVQVVVLAGAQMTDTQRWQVLDTYRRGHHARPWRGLPNFSAASMPAELVTALHAPLRELRQRLDDRLAAAELTSRHAAGRWVRARMFRTGPRADRYGRRGAQLASRFAGAPALMATVAAVDITALLQAVQGTLFRLPRRGSPTSAPPLFTYETTLFQPGCGQPPSAIAADRSRTAASRPTDKRHRQTRKRRRGGLASELGAYTAAVRRLLPVSRAYPDPWSHIPLRRLSQSLNKHRLAGLTPDDVVAGLRTHVSTTSRGWLLDWPSDQVDQQARYLGGLIRDAAAADQLIPLPHQPQ